MRAVGYSHPHPQFVRSRGTLLRGRMTSTRVAAAAMARTLTLRRNLPKPPTINWTDWVDPMTERHILTDDLLTDGLPVPRRFSGAGVDSEQACLVLLANLENSLRSSQAALLARDVIRIEQLASEQAELQHALSACLHSPDPSVPEREDNFFGPRGDAVRATQARVLHLGRVQSVLLRRAQQSLRAISHLLAGPQSDYGPAASGQGIVVRCQQPRSEEA